MTDSTPTDEFTALAEAIHDAIREELPYPDRVIYNRLNADITKSHKDGMATMSEITLSGMILNDMAHSKEFQEAVRAIERLGFGCAATDRKLSGPG